MCDKCNDSLSPGQKVATGIDLRLIDPVIEKYGSVKGSLINMLQAIQEIYGYLPQSAMEYLAEKTDNQKATIYGVATFYTQFRLNPIGKYLILQCQGTACHVNGSKDISRAVCEYLGIEPGQTTEDLLFSVEDVACLGCCSLAPVIMINGEAYGNLTPKKAVKILEELRANENKGA
ncbi:MAG: NADH-quinone oxidoreductase subunit NuoE [Tissierellales bacterium]|jgi:NADH-quinone oxidoreductase subunit E|nr:NADH-quinone oxidoreductase subunit NuoE [Tissierellales bacterium]MBN2828245.1 NADH-quinone oxidoreductase subunit NuoE [Tissierellales bacterium]